MANLRRGKCKVRTHKWWIDHGSAQNPATERWLIVRQYREWNEKYKQTQVMVYMSRRMFQLVGGEKQHENVQRLLRANKRHVYMQQDATCWKKWNTECYRSFTNTRMALSWTTDTNLLTAANLFTHRDFADRDFGDSTEFHRNDNKQRQTIGTGTVTWRQRSQSWTD